MAAHAVGLHKVNIAMKTVRVQFFGVTL